MFKTQYFIVIALLVAIMALGAGCDTQTTAECDNVISALEKFDALHLDSKAQFDAALFTAAQRQVLERHSVDIEVSANLDARKQCLRTFKDAKILLEANDFENLAIELIDTYLRFRDPHSHAMSDAELANRTSSYTGYGFAIERINGLNQVEVVEVIAGTPAHSAGLKKGMTIWMVNGLYLSQKTMKEVAALIDDSPEGTLVLGVTGGPTSQTVYRDVSLKQTSFKVPPVKIATFEENRIAYLKLRSFTESEATFAEGLQTFSSSTVLILDLRDLPGGKVDAALDLADWMTPGKGPFLGLLARDMKQLPTLSLKDPNSIWDGPIVVLVNSGTASAAEILAGVLQDYGAIVVGSTTFGKGTRQTYISLSKFGIAGAAYLTDAFTVRPSGKVVQFNGIKPDVMLPTFKREAIRENHDKLALAPPLDQLPLAGYDPSLLPTRSRAFRGRLDTLEKQLKLAIEAGELGHSEEDQHLEGAKRVALFLAAQAENEAPLPKRD